MSTSITYKGNTIASFSNSTYSVPTKATWVEDDITIVDTV